MVLFLKQGLEPFGSDEHDKSPQGQAQGSGQALSGSMEGFSEKTRSCTLFGRREESDWLGGVCEGWHEETVESDSGGTEEIESKVWGIAELARGTKLTSRSKDTLWEVG